MKVHFQGTWPGPVTLQRGWHRAVARPWNDDLPLAQLRLERGSAGFLADCADALLATAGVAGVLSPPLLPGARAPWEAAGFTPHSRLLLLRRELDALAEPACPVTAGGPDDLTEAAALDRAAFDPFWRLGRAGLSDALTATPRRTLLLARHPGGELAGFAIAGAGLSLAYLQRLAVDPSSRSSGIGRSLARAAGRWARGKGAGALLTNTPEGNEATAAFYESEGFRVVTRDLAVLARTT